MDDFVQRKRWEVSIAFWWYRLARLPDQCVCCCVYCLRCSLQAGGPSMEKPLIEDRAALFPELRRLNISFRPMWSGFAFFAARFQPVPL